MKILFITLVGIDKIEDRNLYADLMRAFVKQGHEVNIVSPIERRAKKRTYVVSGEGYNILRPSILNIQKTNIVEKVLSTISINRVLIKAVARHLNIEGTDLILYSTPPITLVETIRFFKRKTGAYTYLMLKDIFPQNAIDLGMFKAGGLIHRYFRKKELALYEMSDKIGCMSPANVQYVLSHNPHLPAEKVEVCPNCIEPIDEIPSFEEKREARQKLNLPLDKTVFLYGGNLGKPQAVDFILQWLHAQQNKSKAFIVIVGSGTEYSKLEHWFKQHKPENIIIKELLPKAEYDLLVKAADVGMIFLDHRFTIPNFPSRLLSYIEFGLPVICATDRSSDVGSISESNEFGRWVPSDNITMLNEQTEKFILMDRSLLVEMGIKGRTYLLTHYHVDKVAAQILHSYDSLRSVISSSHVE
jgi:Glycosyl transferases group 1